MLNCPKYDIASGRICNRETGVCIPEDEPVFILRAQDKLAMQTLMAYRNLSLSAGQQPDSINERILAFSEFVKQNPQRVKLPSPWPEPSPLTEAEAFRANVPYAPSAPMPIYERHIAGDQSALEAAYPTLPTGDKKVTYAAYDDNIIWGVGETAEAALVAAGDATWCSTAELTPELLRTHVLMARPASGEAAALKQRDKFLELIRNAPVAEGKP